MIDSRARIAVMQSISCAFCKKKHTAFNWRLQYDTAQKKYVWYCDKYFKPVTPEFTTEKIKEDRQRYAKSLLQPYRGGIASQEYIDAYGTGRFDPADVKKARPVWRDVLPSNWQKSE